MTLPYPMDKQIPIASVAFLRKWQRQHRRFTGSTPRRRHLRMASLLALAGLRPEQCAVTTAHQARVEAAFACDFVAEHVAATLRPLLLANALMVTDA